MGFLDKLKNIVRFARITGPADNSANFPVQQMSFKGKVVNVLQIFPYGMYANSASDDSLGVMFSIDGSENNRAAISYTPQRRPNDLEQNEVAIYHPYTNSFIKFRNNGNIEIDSIQDGNTGNIIVNCSNATINASEDVSINASGSVEIDSPSTTVTGTLQVDGAITTDASVTAQGEVTGNGVDLSTHTHVGSPTAPDGPVSNTGAPI